MIQVVVMKLGYIYVVVEIVIICNRIEEIFYFRYQKEDDSVLKGEMRFYVQENYKD